MSLGLKRNFKIARTRFIPKIDKDGGSTEFSGKNDGPVIPIIPAHREGKSGVDETLGQPDVTPRNGKVSNHFT